MRRAALALGILLALSSQVAHADGQISGRLALGFGATLGELPGDFVVELALRSELLFGAPGDEHVRLGPAIELRTGDFDSLELGAGLALLLPVWRGYPFVLSALGGYAFQAAPERESGPTFTTTLAWGFRSYDFHDPYQMSFQVYVSLRTYFQPGAAGHGYELISGIEIDLETLFVTPFRLLITKLRGRDPDEPAYAVPLPGDEEHSGHRGQEARGGD